MTDDGNYITKHNEKIRAQIRRMYRKFKSYPRLERKLGVNRKYLWNLVNKEGYEPTGKAAKKLNWITYVEVEPCPYCGVVHLKKCPNTPRKPQKRTPGGWVNGKDPEKARIQIIERAINDDYLIDLSAMLNEYVITLLEAKE